MTNELSDVKCHDNNIKCKINMIYGYLIFIREGKDEVGNSRENFKIFSSCFVPHLQLLVALKTVVILKLT